MARLLGSATMANDDSTTGICPAKYMPVKSYYLATPSGCPRSRRSGGDTLPDPPPLRRGEIGRGQVVLR